MAPAAMHNNISSGGGAMTAARSAMRITVADPSVYSTKSDEDRARVPPGPIRNPQPAGSGRDGRSVARARHASRSRSRHQGVAPRARAERCLQVAFRARGKDDLAALPSEHLHV